MDATTLGIKQSLFIYTSPAGETWEFVALVNGGCAAVREGTVVDSGDESEESVRRLMEMFFLAAGVRTTARNADTRLHVPPESTSAA